MTITGGGPRLLTELRNTVEREPYMIQFKVKSKVLTILNYHACTHTTAFPEREEISSISSWLMENTHDNVIWAGDMNLVITDRAFGEILSSGFKSALNGEKTSLRMHCQNGDYLSSAEDNILYKLNDHSVGTFKVLDFIEGRDCDLVSDLRDSISDHMPVEVYLN